MSRGIRYFLASVLLLAVLIAWRMFSPYSIPVLLDDVSEDFLKPIFDTLRHKASLSD
jgi:hypothetical protein